MNRPVNYPIYPHPVYINNIPDKTETEENSETGYILNVKLTLKRLERRDVDLFDINRMIQDGFFG